MTYYAFEDGPDPNDQFEQMASYIQRLEIELEAERAEVARLRVALINVGLCPADKEYKRGPEFIP